MTVNCDLCSYQGRNQSTTEHHIKAVHEKVKRYHCDLCDYGAYFRQNFRAHQKNKHGSTEEENPKTGKRKLFSKTNSKRKGKYECQRCSYTTQINQKLKDHINAVHEKVTRFDCTLCDFGTFYKHNLDRHINIKHSNNSDAENIEYKDEVTSNESDVSEHSEKEEIPNQQNQDQDKNSCTICFKSFSNPNYVKEHIEYIHEEIKNYYCDLCSSAFYYDHHLRRHYRTKHEKEMSSDMSKYTKGIAIKTDLEKEDIIPQNDEETIVKIKRLHCKFCDYSSLNPGNLKKHRATLHP